MDTNIRTLLTASQKLGAEKGASNLSEAFNLMKNVAETRSSVDSPEAFGQDLYVICAETAFQHGNPEMAKECLKMYFMKTPPTNQFLCRAYLCQAQLLAPPSAENPEQLEKAVVYLVKAINMAKDNTRYHFLVYNASVIYWQFSRPFLKPKYRQYLAPSLHQVVKALDDIEDKDYEWRAQLMIALIECHMDAGRKSDASHIATAAVSFIKSNVPHLFKTVFGLMVRHQLIDITKFQKDLRISPELHVYYRICRLKLVLYKNQSSAVWGLTIKSVPTDISELFLAIEQRDTDRDIEDEMYKILASVSNQEYKVDKKDKDTVRAGRRSTTPDESNLSVVNTPTPRAALPPKTLDRPHTKTTTRSERRASIKSQGGVSASSVASAGPPTPSLTPPHCPSNASFASSSTSSSSQSCRDSDSVMTRQKSPSRPTRAGARTPTPTMGKKMGIDNPEKPYLLLELGRLALEQRLPTVAEHCVELVKEAVHLVHDQGFFLEVEFLQSELLVKSLGEKQESYQKAFVDIRQQAIKRCDEAIVNAVRLGNPNVIQAGCVTQWNLCLPLLQSNMRQSIRRSLTTVAEALEDIQSLLIQLRCQVHMELAKCEEDIEQIESAMQHIKKALALDDGNVYQERLMVSLRKLQLRAELYKQPESPEDQAAMIIEQARTSGSGTIRMKRSLLVRAGQALAPDAFSLVLESENFDKEVAAAGKGPLTVIRKLAGKAQTFNKNVRKAEGHLRRLGNERDRERAQMWGDLAKTARKQEVWDVCRVAARFCLLYDDDRWKIEPPVKERKSKVKRAEEGDTSQDSGTGGEQTREKTQASMKREATVAADMLTDPSTQLYDRDLVRMMAEVNFINGEGLIHLLRSEGVQLGDRPIPPEDKSKHPKGYVPKKPEEDPDWIEYVQWIESLSDSAVSSFLRAASLGQDLTESWIVVNSGAYLWNYYNHVLQYDRHKEIVESLQTLLDGMKKVGHAGETVLLVNVCNALAVGLIQPWLPPPVVKETVVPSPLNRSPGDASPSGTKSPKRGGAKAEKAPAAGAKKSVPAVTISTDSVPDLKRAVEVCEYAMKITNGDHDLDVVPVANRQPLLQTWVLAKQMLQQQLSKTFGAEDENDQEGQKPMTRAIVATEMAWVASNGIFEFRETPQLTQIVDLIERCSWTDRLVELQLWTRLAHMAFENKDHNTVVKAAAKAMYFGDRGTQPKGKKQEPHKYMVEQEMLSYAARIYGESLVLNTQGKNAVRRQAMQQFLTSARFGKNAKNYDMVITAARHYWNTALPLINQPIERELLAEPINMMLEYIAEVTDKDKYKRKEDEDDDEESETEKTPKKHGSVTMGGAPNIPPAQPDDSTDVEAELQQLEANEKEKSQMATGIIGGPDDDLTLRASLYGVLFQSYADRGEWEAGLRAMDKAIADMPRTNHRLLIFKHLVVVKAKLGLNVGMSIQKFKDESEDYVAHMWRRVALCSKQQLEQLQGYQNAIEALNSPSNEWQKFDYLLEFGQWLYHSEFPLQDALDQFEWAVDILLNMKFEKEQKKDEKKGKKAKGKKGKTPPSSAGKDKKEKGGAKAGKKGDSKKPAKDDGRKTPSAVTETEVSETNVKEDLGVPVKKEAVIGVAPNNPNLQLSDLSDIKQLDGLFRAHVLLAQVAGRNHRNYNNYCLMAVSYIQRMWQVSVGQSGMIVKELAKMNALKEAEGGANKGSAKGKGGKGGKGAKEEPAKDRPKRKGPLDVLPGNAEQWAEYDAPDEVLEAFKTEQMKTIGINTETISKPTLTMYYLDLLVRQLKELDYNHLTLPVLAMADILAKELLKHRPLYALVHLKAMEVCIELNLQSGASFHEKLADFNMTEDEQAKCREEMALWKEKQLQVAKEEMRIKESLARMKQEDSQMISSKEKDILAKATVRVKAPGDEERMKEDEGEGTGQHLGKKIGAVQFRDVWTDTAETLLDNGLYQPARALLNESLQAARAFEEVELEARVLFQLARLSFFEAQYLQAVNLCIKAQKTYDGDEMFWYHTTLLMVEATMADHELKYKDRTRKARAVLIHALNVFTGVAETRPNKAAITGYVIAKLEAKLGTIQANIAMVEHDNILKPKVTDALLSACKKMQHSAANLLRLGFKQECVQIMKEEAEIFIKLARESSVTSDKHDFYVQALGVYRETVAISDDIFNEVQTLASLLDMKNVSTPALRQSASTKVACCEIMLEMFDQHIQEERRKQLDNVRKGSVVRAVEEFVAETPTYEEEPLTREWVETCKVLGECALVHLSAAHNMAGTISDIKARSLYNIGRCLRLLAVHKHPDPPKQWHIQDMTMLNLKEISTSAQNLGSMKGSTQNLSKQDDKKTEKTDTVMSDEEDEDPFEAKQKKKYRQQMAQVKAEVEMSQQYMLQATEVLTQAVNLSLAKGYTETAGLSSLELVECFGQLDPGLSSQYLAVYQSCQASQYLESLLDTALVDPTTSQQAALFHQRKNLMKRNVTTNAWRGPVMKTVRDKLQEHSTAWKRLAVSPNHLELLKDLNPNFNFFIMQHSPDKKHLYCSIMDKPNPVVPPAGKGGASKGPKNMSKAKVMRVDTSPKQLEDLLSRYYWYKHEVMQFLLKMEYQRSLFAQREKMLANLDDADKDKESGNPLLEDWEEDERRLHEEFLNLLQAMESYLRPLTEHLDIILRPPSATTISESKEPKKGKEKGEKGEKGSGEPEPPNEYAILLADQHLLELPLEALQALHQDTIVSITRDISLQMFHHKFFVEQLDEAEIRERKRKEETKPPSRIPGMRDAAKKLAKIIPLDRPVKEGNVPVDTHLFRYIVDPHMECSETEEKKPIECFKSMIEEHEMQFTPRWLGVYGSEHAASVGEYEIYMLESSSFVFYGMERFLAYLPPSKVASLNFDDCQMVVLFDRAQTNNSFARQSKQDVLKTQEVLRLERSVDTAMLLSLAGVKSVFCNQWHCTLAENAEKMELLVRDILPKGKTTGQACHLLLDPVKRQEELKAEREAELAKLAEKEKPGTRGKDEPPKTASDESEETQEGEEPVEEAEPLPVMGRSWYNMVCYGLPNIVITQLSKP